MERAQAVIGYSPVSVVGSIDGTVTASDPSSIGSHQATEVRLIVFKGYPRPPLPPQTAGANDLWVLPRVSVDSFEGLLDTLHRLGATEDDEQFAMLLPDGFKVHRDFWEFFVARHSVLYICLIQEEMLPPYAARMSPILPSPQSSPSTPPREREQQNPAPAPAPHSPSPPQIPRSPPRTPGREIVDLVTPPPGFSVQPYMFDPVRFFGPHATPRARSQVAGHFLPIQARFYDIDGELEKECLLITRMRHTMDVLHERLLVAYQGRLEAPVGKVFSHLELRWGPQRTVRYPSRDSGRFPVRFLENREDFSMDVVPVCVEVPDLDVIDTEACGL